MKKIALVLLSGVFLTSCQKSKETNQLNNPGQLKSTLDVHYYMDGTEVDQNSFEYDDPDLYFLYVFGDPEDSTSERAEAHAFSDSLDMISYGEDNSVPIETIDRISQHLASYALSSGVIEEAELNGEIPSWWDEYEEEYIDGVLSEAFAVHSILPTYVRKNCSEGPGTYLLPYGHPWLWLYGYKEDVESYRAHYLYGAESNYHRSFYRKRNWTIWTWGWQDVNLCTPFPWLANKGNSWLTIGFP